MITPEGHDELVLRLYDHASDSELTGMFRPWVSAFRSIGSHTLLIDPGGAVVESSHEALVVGVPREYEAHWRNLDPRMALALARPERVFSDVEHIDAAAFERSEVYNAVLRPFDVRYSLFGTMRLSNGYTLAQAVMRRRAQGAFDATDVAALQRLWAHVRRVFELRLELQALRTRNASLAGALDAMPSPLFVLDAHGRVYDLNAAASELLASRDGLQIKSEQLVTSSPRTTSLLRIAVAQALICADLSAGTRRTPPAAPVRTIEVARARRRPLTLVVHPIRPPVLHHDLADRRVRALVVVHDPEASTKIARSVLAQLHGLTPTEAELAASIAEGKSLADFAEARGCAEGTARVHLKRVFEKTGTRRQAELVHRILASAALRAVQS